VKTEIKTKKTFSFAFFSFLVLVLNMADRTPLGPKTEQEKNKKRIREEYFHSINGEFVTKKEYDTLLHHVITIQEQLNIQQMHNKYLEKRVQDIEEWINNAQELGQLIQNMEENSPTKTEVN